MPSFIRFAQRWQMSDHPFKLFNKLCYLCTASDDSRKTHLSSRCHVLRDRTNRRSSPSLSQPSHEATNAWQCVDAQHGFNTSMSACPAEACHIHNMRKHHEERTANVCSQHDKVNQGGAFYNSPCTHLDLQ